MTRQLNTTLFLALLLAGVVSFTGCRKADLELGYPNCVEKMIEDIEDRNDNPPQARISRWEVDGLTYYALDPGCCDQFIELYDEDCNYVCAPSGGIGGQGDGLCPSWTEQPTITLVWEDQ
jgi:hypothetical protein